MKKIENGLEEEGWLRAKHGRDVLSELEHLKLSLSLHCHTTSIEHEHFGKEKKKKGNRFGS